MDPNDEEIKRFNKPRPYLINAVRTNPDFVKCMWPTRKVHQKPSIEDGCGSENVTRTSAITEAPGQSDIADGQITKVKVRKDETVLSSKSDNTIFSLTDSESGCEDETRHLSGVKTQRSEKDNLSLQSFDESDFDFEDCHCAVETPSAELPKKPLDTKQNESKAQLKVQHDDDISLRSFDESDFQSKDFGGSVVDTPEPPMEPEAQKQAPLTDLQMTGVVDCKPKVLLHPSISAHKKASVPVEFFPTALVRQSKSKFINVQQFKANEEDMNRMRNTISDLMQDLKDRLDMINQDLEADQHLNDVAPLEETQSQKPQGLMGGFMRGLREKMTGQKKIKIVEEIGLENVECIGTELKELACTMQRRYGDTESKDLERWLRDLARLQNAHNSLQLCTNGVSRSPSPPIPTKLFFTQDILRSSTPPTIVIPFCADVVSRSPTPPITTSLLFTQDISRSASTLEVPFNAEDILRTPTLTGPMTPPAVENLPQRRCCPRLPPITNLTATIKLLQGGSGLAQKEGKSKKRKKSHAKQVKKETVSEEQQEETATMVEDTKKEKTSLKKRFLQWLRSKLRCSAK